MAALAEHGIVMNHTMGPTGKSGATVMRFSIATALYPADAEVHDVLREVKGHGFDAMELGAEPAVLSNWIADPTWMRRALRNAGLTCPVVAFGRLGTMGRSMMMCVLHPMHWPYRVLPPHAMSGRRSWWCHSNAQGAEGAPDYRRQCRTA